MEAAEKLRLTSIIVLLGFILAFFYYGFIEFFYGGLFKNFLGSPLYDRFMDFYNLYDLAIGLNPYFSLKGELGNYLPFAYLLMWPFTWMSRDAAFIVFIFTFIYSVCWTFNYFLSKVASTFHRLEYLQIILILVFLSWPVLFALGRGNLDCLIFALTSLFLICFINKKFLLAAIFLSVVIALKAYPAIFILLYFKEKKFYTGMLCILLSCLLTVIALFSFRAGFTHSLHRYLQIAAIYQSKQALYTSLMTFSASLFQFIKMIYAYIDRLHDFSLSAYLATLKKILLIYEVFTVVSAIFIAWFFLRCPLVRWKQVMLLTLMMILFPPISGDYKLLFLFLPFLLFVIAEVKDPRDYLYTILFSLLFIPKNYYFFPKTISYSSTDAINICIMLFFGGQIIASGLRNAREKNLRTDSSISGIKVTAAYE